jgi:hypothetical protein
LILDNIVSAGWETIAAAKPAMRPDSRLTPVSVVVESPGVLIWVKIVSDMASNAANLVIE